MRRMMIGCGNDLAKYCIALDSYDCSACRQGYALVSTWWFDLRIGEEFVLDKVVRVLALRAAKVTRSLPEQERNALVGHRLNRQGHTQRG